MKRTLLTATLIANFCIATAQADMTDSRSLTTTEGTTPHDVTASVTRYQGYDGLLVKVAKDHKTREEGGCDNCAFLALDGFDFHNGTIEIEVAGRPSEKAPKWARGFVGLVFRASPDAKTFEGVYLRPLNAIEEDQSRRDHTVQYFSYPDYPWHKLRETAPSAYESYAPIKPGEWTHMRLDVEGQTVKLTLNHASEPSLIVTDLKHGADQRGLIGLFTEPHTEAYFRNLTVTHRP